MKFRKKPVVINAIQFKDSAYSISRVTSFVGDTLIIDYKVSPPTLKIPTLEGVMIASVNDYIIQGVNGEFYPCKPDIFEKTYDIV